MKPFIVLFLSFISFQTIAQSKFSKEIITDWKLDEIKREDESKVYDSKIQQFVLDLDFFSKDSVYIKTDGKISRSKYVLIDSLLTFSGLSFKIVKLDNISLEIVQLDGETGFFALKFVYLPKKLADLTFTPDSYLSKTNEVVYLNIPGKLEPLFAFNGVKPMDNIFEKFDFPPYRKGGFVVRFVITSEGELKGVRVVASSNDRYNAKLLAAVYDTKGKWVPAKFMGEKVNVEIQYDYNLGFDETSGNSNMVDSLQYSNMNYEYGNEFFERKSYKQAESYYTKAINYNPTNVKAYYQRAASNVILRKPDEACADYQTLIFLDQNKAKDLYEKFCVKK